MPVVLLAGDFNEGFKAFGPFKSRDDADDYAETNRIIHNHSTTIAVMVNPFEVKLVKGDEPCIVAAGNVVHGFSFYGPFKDEGDAQGYVDNLPDKSVIVGIMPGEELPNPTCTVCGEEMDTDCQGEPRCTNCDPCPHCFDGGGPT
jgi:hypothetical protein